MLTSSAYLSKLYIRMKKINHNQNGFTLIELLVVIAIIGILAAVGVVAYNGYTGAAKVNATKANHKSVCKWTKSELVKCDLDSSVSLSLIHI